MVTEDGEELLTYEQAADEIGVGYQAIAEMVAKGALRPVAHDRYVRGKRKYFRRSEIVIYAQLRSKTRQELERELVAVYLNNGHAPPTSPSPTRGARSSTAPSASAESMPTAEPIIPPTGIQLSPHALRAAITKLVQQGLEAEGVKRRREDLQREPGEELTSAEMFKRGLAVFLGEVVGALAVSFVMMAEDHALEDHWRLVQRHAETDPAVKNFVDEIWRIHLSGTAPIADPIDPRQIALFDQERPGTEQQAALTPPANGPPDERSRSPLEGAA